MAQLQAQLEEWSTRMSKLQDRLRHADLQGCVISQNVGIYYYTGAMQTGYLFVPAEGEPTYYVRRSVVRAERESKVRTAELISFRNFGEQLAGDYPWLEPSTDAQAKPIIGADLDVMPAQLYLRLAEAVPQVS